MHDVGQVQNEPAVLAASEPKPGAWLDGEASVAMLGAKVVLVEAGVIGNYETDMANGHDHVYGHFVVALPATNTTRVHP